MTAQHCTIGVMAVLQCVMCTVIAALRTADYLLSADHAVVKFFSTCADNDQYHYQQLMLVTHTLHPLPYQRR